MDPMMSPQIQSNDGLGTYRLGGGEHRVAGECEHGPVVMRIGVKVEQTVASAPTERYEKRSISALADIDHALKHPKFLARMRGTRHAGCVYLGGTSGLRAV
jgi:hypothetical protein